MSKEKCLYAIDGAKYNVLLLSKKLKNLSEALEKFATPLSLEGQEKALNFLTAVEGDLINAIQSTKITNATLKELYTDYNKTTDIESKKASKIQKK